MPLPYVARLVGLVGLLGALGVSGVAGGAADTSSAVAYQIDAAHSGVQPGVLPEHPLRKIWRVQFEGGISYPLIVEGKVFVTVAKPGCPPCGTTLYALDAASGTELWSAPITGTGIWSNAAYDSGRVFVLNFDGFLQAFSADTGSLEWAQDLPFQNAFTSPPTADQGVVHVGGAGTGGTVYAVRGSDGLILWTASVANGDNSSPALSPTSLFVSYAGPQIFAFDRFSGAPLWRYSGQASGGGGKTAVYANGRLFTRDFFLSGVFNAGTGELLGPLNSTTAPAVDGDVAYTIADGRLTAMNVAAGTSLWTFAGDGSLQSAPIVVNTSGGKRVFVGSAAGRIFGVSGTSGKKLFSMNAGAPIPAPNEQGSFEPMTGLAAAQGMLIVPAGSTLTAYG